ncbi:hypothetical protein ACFQ3L_05515 [Lacticaseibacillus jixianensis]|uniref:DUF3800 domain-containing protein n=1 Tax=Lacticaseibacillus jixianensis TaxID=2486012 RepID=A0ABW4B7V3_9LACO|nr:helix-turn-helix transcriptional regulator [Lacticaseibacillus jixianensis]
MTEATAYRLKQIMTQEHLSLTQAAKQIGISASSMRKVLKDTPMSRPITFKINRFIDEHPVQQSKNSFTIFDSAEEEAQSAAPKATQPAATPKPEPKAPQKTDQQATRKPDQKAPQQAAQQPVAKPAKPNSKPAAQQPAADESKPTKQPRRRGRRQPDKSQPGTQQNKQSQQNQQKRNSQPAQSHEQPKAQPQQPAKPAEQAEAKQQSRRNRRAEAPQKDAQASNRRRPNRSAEQHQDKARKPAQAAASEPQAKQAAPSSAAVQPALASSNAAEAISVPAAKAPSTAPASTAPQATDHTDSHPARQDQTILIYMDESFGGGSDYQRNMSIGATVVDPDDEQALIPFMQTLYPFGWQPGDEVKARGKAREQLEAMLRHANTDRVLTYAVYSPLSDTGNFSLSFGILYPYVAALIRILNALPSAPTKVRVAMDQRSEITDEQLAMAARMLHAYVKAQTGRDVIFMFRTTDSKQTIGVQYSDFVSHAAMIFGPDQIASTGIHKLPAIGTQLGDQLQLFAMVGLQKYLLNDGPSQDDAPEPFKNPLLNAADRMTHLAEKAADMQDAPEETFAQGKLVVNQLLQIAPSSVSGAINKMPFQNWYDILARTAAILHYTDESLPPFRIDPDAMQIATDALNTIQALLAGAR